MNGNYALVCRDNKQTYAHHDILPPKEGLDVDHINGDKHDNRPENLQYLPRHLNAIHRHRNCGVDKRPSGNWRVRVGLVHLGMTTTQAEGYALRNAYIDKIIQEWLE